MAATSEPSAAAATVASPSGPGPVSLPDGGSGAGADDGNGAAGDIGGAAASGAGPAPATRASRASNATARCAGSRPSVFDDPFSAGAEDGDGEAGRARGSIIRR